MVPVAIALGSNLGDRHAHLSQAILECRRVLSGLVASVFVETAFEGDGTQPAYLNGAACGTWGGAARQLLDILLEIERRAGRERPFPAAPRTLDLDLILFGTSIIDEPGLVVPHPRFRERGFVLRPLAEIAPEMIDPVSGRRVSELLQSWEERKPCASR
ncbi:MAG: 2-amino-4-hydroxy-6-hydroxymethyldihydropteridine diphosphokinase [Acidobacteria bacterium]|nr:2-amino-4-hydroxy-6-hydroxymethyldihydropteridine diphosphokinase [Acidobacteriota bacterium]